MQFLVFTTILSGVLGQLVKIPLGLGNLYLLDLLAVFTVTLWVILKLIERDYKFKIPSHLLPLFFFLFWAVITLVLGKTAVSLSELLTGGFYLVRFSFYSLFSLVVYDLKLKSVNSIFEHRLFKVLVASCVIIALAGFVQLVIYPDITRLAAEFGYDPHKNRLVSTFLDPNFTAAYLVLGLILVICRIEADPKVRWGAAGLFFSALVLTFSRSGWLMFSAALMLFGFLKSPKLLLVALFAGFLAYFAVPRVQTRISGITDPDDSAKLRLVSWSHALEIAQEKPIFGVGFNLYRQAQERFGFFDYHDFSGGHAGGGSDSSLLLVLATTGVVGLILFLLTFVNIFVKSLTKTTTYTGIILVLSLPALLIDSQFINSFFFPQIMLWVWVLVGLL